jgi:2-dehydro-3-deoxygluconokinase
MTQDTAPPLIVGLGEAMLRLSSPHMVPLQMATELQVHVAGAELNVLIAAAALGARGRWLTRLPANQFGEMIRGHARKSGLEVVAQDEIEGRAGLYFLEFGVPPRPSTVLYDRRDSASSHLSADEFAWDQVLDGASAVHVTGITCALGDGPLAATLAFLGTASELGVMTSFDMNNRSQLWDIEQARAGYRRVLPMVDTLFVTPGDLSLLCEREDDIEILADEVVQEFGISTMVIRERYEVSLQEIGTSVRVLGESSQPALASGCVVDEIGAGDAAAGAFLASMLLGETRAVSAERCARAYARMLTIPGDSWSGTLHDLTDGYVTSRKVVR